MPRTARPDLKNAVVHVISRGVDRRDIFTNDGDRLAFLRFMREAFRPFGIKVIAFCLMGNHFHPLLPTGALPLDKAMHHLLLRYAMYFNGRHKRVGHLFQARYKAFLVRHTRRLFHLVDYIHQNPVAAGFVDDAGDWPWSSHHEFITACEKRTDLSSLEELTGVTPEELREAYRAIWERRCSGLKVVSTLTDHLERAADIAGVAVSEILERGDTQIRKAREIFVRSATESGFRSVELATAIGCSEAAVSQMKRRLKLSTCPLA